MTITVQVDTTQAIAKLGAVTENVRAALRQVIMQDGPELASRVRSKLSGQVLQVRTGALLASIQNEMVENSTSIYGRVYSSGVRYAAIHEFGGIIRHPGSSKFQSWIGPDGKHVATHYTRPHDIPMPERSYLRSSLAEMRDRIIADMTAAVKTSAYPN